MKPWCSCSTARHARLGAYRHRAGGAPWSLADSDRQHVTAWLDKCYAEPASPAATYPPCAGPRTFGTAHRSPAMTTTTVTQQVTDVLGVSADPDGLVASERPLLFGKA